MKKTSFDSQSPKFGGLVIGCAEADVCKWIFILMQFSRSTRSAHVCTALTEDSYQHLVNIGGVIHSTFYFTIVFAHACIFCF